MVKTLAMEYRGSEFESRAYLAKSFNRKVHYIPQVPPMLHNVTRRYERYNIIIIRIYLIIVPRYSLL